MYVTPVEYRNFPSTLMNCRSVVSPRGIVRAIVEGELFQSARSSSFFLLSSFFFSHPESCLDMKKKGKRKSEKKEKNNQQMKT